MTRLFAFFLGTFFVFGCSDGGLDKSATPGEDTSLGQTDSSDVDTDAADTDTVPTDSETAKSLDEARAEWIARCEGATSESRCESVSRTLPDLLERYGMIDAWHGCGWGTFTKQTVDADGGCDAGESIDACYYQSGGEEGFEQTTIDGCGQFDGYPTYFEDGDDFYLGLAMKQRGGEKFKRCDFGADGAAPAACRCVCDTAAVP